MKLRLLLIAILAALAATGVALTVARHRQSQRRIMVAREERYKAALQSYTEAFTPGLTRKAVEADLAARRVTFRNVYIAFEFAATHPTLHMTASDTDVLKRVAVYRQLEGCL
jgi:hypothetical protein